jgi:Tol biopolymer transport system component
VTPERWERIGALYEAASALPSENRAAFLREACGEDLALCAEVESLLASGNAAGEFLRAGAIADAAKTLAEEGGDSIVGMRLGDYEVVSLVGSGGMGEVYRARDVRLGRDVAVKVLPALAAQTASARWRFHREARAVAALAHPHIRSLYDVGEADGRLYAVMELLEGETLRARLSRGPLPPRKAMAMAAAIADGLGAAHARGIVHRDLKPENVFITAGGHVKVLDFGLAKLPEPASANVRAETMPGVAVGTPGYMSPEQVAGREVDARSDIFSFGCVLFEMLSGTRAFDRNTTAETMAAILNDEPPELTTSPGELHHIVAHCLEKELAARFQSAQDLAFQLRTLLGDGEARKSKAVLAPTRWRGAPWLAAAVVAAVGIAIASWSFGRREPAARIQSYLLPPDNGVFCHDCGIAISPDGLRLAFVARAAGDAAESLWIQPLSGLPAQRLAGTEGAKFPFWSPDSRTVAFFSGNTLLRIDESGSPRKLCSPCGGQGTWSAEGTIVFGQAGSPLRAVHASGGDAFPVTDLNRGDAGHIHPVFLKDGRHLLFRNADNVRERGIFAASLDSKATTLITRTNGINTAQSKVLVAAGQLLFVQENTLMAAPFDAARLRLEGDAVPIALTRGPFSVSDTGTLVYSQRPRFTLAWLDRSGREIKDLAIQGDFYAPRLSHDGRRVALGSFDEAGRAAGDIWVYDLARRVGTRITTDPANDRSPLWSPDDESIVFGSDRSGRASLYRRRSTGVGRDELVLASDVGYAPTSSSSDGRVVILQDSRDDQDLWQVSLPAETPRRLFETPFRESSGQLSPDDKWLAYSSDETGQPEVYVQPFPPSGARWRISTGGGAYPRWRADGKELFYSDATRKIMAVDVTLRPSFDAGAPHLLFDASTLRDIPFFYDVSGDGQRFLVVKLSPNAGVRPVTLLQNWMANLKK